MKSGDELFKFLDWLYDLEPYEDVYKSILLLKKYLKINGYGGNVTEEFIKLVEEKGENLDEVIVDICKGIPLDEENLEEIIVDICKGISLDIKKET